MLNFFGFSEWVKDRILLFYQSGYKKVFFNNPSTRKRAEQFLAPLFSYFSESKFYL